MKTYKRDNIGRFATHDVRTREQRMCTGSTFDAVLGASIVCGAILALIVVLPYVAAFIGQVVYMWRNY